MKPVGRPMDQDAIHMEWQVFSFHTARSNVTCLRVSPKVLLSLLLIVSVVPLFFVQNVNSQQFRTLTSYTTITATSASLEYYSQATTSVQTTGFTWSFTLTYRLGTGYYSCLAGFTPFPFNITRSQTIHIDYSSDIQTDFALFNSPTFAAWTMQSDPCFFMLYFNKMGVTSGSYDVSLDPGTGQAAKGNNPYWFVFLHRGSGILPKIRIAVNGFLLQQPTFVTLTNTHMITGTEPLTSYKTEQVPFLEANASWLILVASAGAVVALLLTPRPRRRKPRRKRSS